ncbi:MAG TPA: zf-HC2 domain-containing protein [Blastocatellia bacterium]|nr:zf-HC2 domain-containing protein [Blastocatellia bacterium]
MDCRIVRNSLSNYLDGLLLENEVTLIESHFNECSHCNVVRLDLFEIRSAARELPLHTPQRALWARIQQSIEAETAGEADEVGKPEVAKQPGWLSRRWADLMSRRFTFNFPQLAGAGTLAVLLVGVGLFSAYRQGAGPAVSTGPDAADLSTALLPEEPETRARVKFLTTTLDARKASWDPAIQKLYDSNLMRITQSIEECRQKLRENKNDKEHQQRVRDLYREQIELLEDFDKIR